MAAVAAAAVAVWVLPVVGVAVAAAVAAAGRCCLRCRREHTDYEGTMVSLIYHRFDGSYFFVVESKNSTWSHFFSSYSFDE